MPATASAIFFAVIGPRVVSTPVTRPSALARKAGDLAILHDVDAEPVGAARIAPDHRVVARRAGARLQQPALDRKARIVEIEEGRQRAHLLAVEQFRIGAGSRMALPRRA